MSVSLSSTSVPSSLPAALPDTGDDIIVPRQPPASALQLQFSESPLPKSLEDGSGRIVAVNDAFCRLFGLDSTALPGRLLAEVPQLRLLAAPAGNASSDQNGAGAFAPERYAVGRTDGAQLVVERLTEPWFAEQGPARVQSLWIDVTARQPDTVALARVERAFELFDQIPVGLVLTDVNGAILRANAAMRDIAGSALERFVASAVAESSPAQLPSQSSHREALTLDDGRALWIDRRVATLPVVPGIVTTRIIAAIDISREVAMDAERAAHEASQHQVHIREVHHRIKNNLQGIAGLIQHNSYRWPHAASMLGALSEQIYAVAEIYGLQSNERGTLSLQEAIKAIARNLSRVYGRPITVSGQNNAELQRWSLSQNDAMSTALVLNELMTNALKHSVGDAVCSVSISADADACIVQICNPGELSASAVGRQAGVDLSGIGLVRAMLPDRGDELAFAGEHGLVTVTLRLRPPMIKRC